MRNLLKRMLGIASLACAFVLPLGGAQAAEVVSGDLVWGHEVRALRPDGSTESYWLVDRTGKLRRQYAQVAGLDAAPYTPIRAEVFAEKSGKAVDGFAAAYDGVYEVKKIVSLRSLDGRSFSSQLDWKETSFKVESKDNVLRIKPMGLSISNRAVEHGILGYTVESAEAGDLDGDGNAEVFVYLRSDGSGSYGKLVAYSVNDGKSMSNVYMAPFKHEGYMGHEKMRMEGDVFTISFPVYKPGDSNAAPSGGSETVRYRLVKGEAGKVLQEIK